MDRTIVYYGEVAQNQDILQSEMNAYNAFGHLISSILGQTTQVNGFACTATSPTPSLAVTIGVGELYILEPTDTTQYGDAPPNGFAPDSTPLMKQGILSQSTNLSVTAPVTSGQSINYLVQVAFSEVDGDEASRQFYSAPVYRTVFQLRQDKVILSAKAGSPATTGTQSTPSPDAGYTGLWVVTVAYGQTTVTSSNISQYASTTFLTDKLKDKITFAQGDTRYLQLSGQPNNNYFINPVMNIAQATDSLTLAATETGYVCDMIKHVGGSAGAATVTYQAYTTPGSVVPGASNFLRHAQGTGGTGWEIQFAVENVSQFAGRTVTFRVYCLSNNTISVTGAYTQTFGTGGSANVTGSSLTSAQSITSTANYIDFQFSLPSIAGKTMGNKTGTLFRLQLPNAVFTLDIYSAGVYGSSIAAVPFSMGYDYDLQKCRRFFETSYSHGTYPGAATAIGAEPGYKKIMLVGAGGTPPNDIEMIYIKFVQKPYNIAYGDVTVYNLDGDEDYVTGVTQDGTYRHDIPIAIQTGTPTLWWAAFNPSDRNFFAYTTDGGEDWPQFLYHWVVDCRF